MRARGVAFGLALVLVAYLGLVAWRGWVLLDTGNPLSILLGVAVIVIPTIGAWVLYQEIRFGLATQAMARQLADEGLLPVDDLPRRASGRIERSAADARFGDYAAAVEVEPNSWRAWFRLGIAYDDAGDRRRARSAMRHASALFDSNR